jgi:hypothetical protein
MEYVIYHVGVLGALMHGVTLTWMRWFPMRRIINKEDWVVDNMRG